MPPKETAEEIAIDLNNPETWPNDIDSLAEIAGEDTGNADVFAGEREIQAKSTPEEPKPGEGDEPKETPKAAEPEDKPKVTEPEDTPKPKEGQATEEDLDKLKPEEAVVKTPDGKHEIPFDVLKSARTRAQELEQENLKLQEQLAAKQASEAAAAAAPATDDKPAEAEKRPVKVSEVELSEDQAKEIDQVKEEYGETMANLHANQLRANALLEQQLAESNAIAERLAREDKANTDDEATQIQSAIDAAPQMVAWQTGSDPADSAMYGRAVELHHVLLKNDPSYAVLGWEERFAALPAKVVAVYGEQGTVVAATPGATETPKPATDQTAIAAEAAKKAAKAEADSHPVTMSDLPAGEIPVADEITRSLENQTGAQVTDMMTRLANDKDPNKLANFLDGLS